MNVGDLVKMKGFGSGDWDGQMGIITKIPKTKMGRWAIRLTSGELIATMRRERMEVINASR